MLGNDSHICTICKVPEGQLHTDTCPHFHPTRPFIYYPRLCRKCGNMIRGTLKIPSVTWDRYIPKSYTEFPLCPPCFETIQQCIDKASVNTNFKSSETQLSHDT